ncbi:MAG TPA: glutaminase, partial [Lachnospiraceae bacterium]|nr:glutaminase [Lachnospiraceae bacterium]
TDDFAGHLAHNCNLAAKAIMGIAGFGIIMENLAGQEEGAGYLKTAGSMAESWIERAANGDGTFRLTFDQPDTFSMKYNLIWDRIFQTNFFTDEILKEELKSYIRHMNPYGMPLDNRAAYTKSDWLVWSASLMKNKEDFERMIEPLWKAYHESESRVPMTDWYDTLTAKQIGFQHRSVQGGLFIKLLVDRGISARRVW